MFVRRKNTTISLRLLLSVCAIALAVGFFGSRIWLSNGDIRWTFTGQKTKEEFTKYYAERRVFLQREIRHVGQCAVPFFGDSRIEGLNVDAVVHGAVNLGIGGETTRRLNDRISDYSPFRRWDYVVMAVGFNDTNFRSPSEAIDILSKTVEYVGSDSPIFLVSVLPADEDASVVRSNSAINEFNTRLEKLANSNSNIRFVDARHGLVSSQGLLPSMHNGDGVHLNRQGQKVYISNLRRVLPAGRGHAAGSSFDTMCDD